MVKRWSPRATTKAGWEGNHTNMGRFKERRREIKKLPLKDRPGWIKFKEMLPGLASGIASLVPGGKVISTIIDSISKDPDTSDQAKVAALDFLEPIEHEESIVDLADVQDARAADIARMSSPDWLGRNIVPLIAITWTSFSIVIFMLILFRKVMVSDNIAFLVMNTVGNILMLVVGYYFGSTASSKQKDNTIQQMQKQITP